MQYLDESNNSNEGTESLSSASTSVNTQKIVNNLVISDVPVRDLKTTGQNVGFNPVTEEMEQPRYNGGPYQVAPPPPVQDLSERMLTLYLQHLGNSVYLMLIIALGFVYPLINALSYGTEKQEQSKEQFEIFMIIIHGISIIVLSVVLIRLTLRKSDEDRGHGEGLNFFLRIGAIVFCIGVIILNILRALEPVELLVMQNCSTPVKPTHICYYSLSVIFYALQTYFMFKYHKTSFLSGPNRQEQYVLQIWIVKAILMHLTGANVIIWISSIMWESVEIFTHANHLYQNSSKTFMSFAAKAQPYLFPCVIEYSLVAAGTFLTLNRCMEAIETASALQIRSGEKLFEAPSRDSTSLTDDFTLGSEDGNSVGDFSESRTADRSERSALPFLSSYMYLTKEMDRISLHVRASQVIHQDRSLWTRLTDRKVLRHTIFNIISIVIAISGILVILIMFYEFTRKTEVQMENIRQWVLLYWVLPYILSTIFAAMLCHKMLYRFKYEFRLSHDMTHLLLNATYFCNLIMHILCIIADTSYLYEGRDLSANMTYFAYSFIQIMQETIQNLFLLCAHNMRAKTARQRIQKAGRATLSLLIALNVILWLEQSLVVKSFIITDRYIKFYGLMEWCLLTSIFHPLLVFYRFESASMLSAVWLEAYQ